MFIKLNRQDSLNLFKLGDEMLLNKAYTLKFRNLPKRTVHRIKDCNSSVMYIRRNGQELGYVCMPGTSYESCTLITRAWSATILEGYNAFTYSVQESPNGISIETLKETA